MTRVNLGQNSPVFSTSRILAPAGGRATAGVVRGLASRSLGLWRALRAARRARFGPNASALRDLVAANRILANERIVDGYGHVSARAVDRPERFFLARAMAPGLVKAADLIEYDLDGDSVHGASRDGYVERFLHAAIYRARPDVGAIVHCHTPSLIPFADSSVPLRPMYHMSAFLALGAPIFEIRDVASASEMLVSDARIGRALADTLGDAAVPPDAGARGRDRRRLDPSGRQPQHLPRPEREDAGGGDRPRRHGRVPGARGHAPRQHRPGRP